METEVPSRPEAVPPLQQLGELPAILVLGIRRQWVISQNGNSEAQGWLLGRLPAGCVGPGLSALFVSFGPFLGVAGTGITSAWASPVCLGLDLCLFCAVQPLSQAGRAGAGDTDTPAALWALGSKGPTSGRAKHWDDVYCFWFSPTGLRALQGSPEPAGEPGRNALHASPHPAEQESILPVTHLPPQPRAQLTPIALKGSFPCGFEGSRTGTLASPLPPQPRQQWGWGETCLLEPSLGHCQLAPENLEAATAPEPRCLPRSPTRGHHGHGWPALHT